MELSRRASAVPAVNGFVGDCVVGVVVVVNAVTSSCARVEVRAPGRGGGGAGEEDDEGDEGVRLSRTDPGAVDTGVRGVPPAETTKVGEDSATAAAVGLAALALDDDDDKEDDDDDDDDDDEDADEDGVGADGGIDVTGAVEETEAELGRLTGSATAMLSVSMDSAADKRALGASDVCCCCCCCCCCCKGDVLAKAVVTEEPATGVGTDNS